MSHSNALVDDRPKIMLFCSPQRNYQNSIGKALEDSLHEVGTERTIAIEVE